MFTRVRLVFAVAIRPPSDALTPCVSFNRHVVDVCCHATLAVPHALDPLHTVFTRMWLMFAVAPRPLSAGCVDPLRVVQLARG